MDYEAVYRAHRQGMHDLLVSCEPHVSAPAANAALSAAASGDWATARKEAADAARLSPVWRHLLVATLPPQDV